MKQKLFRAIGLMSGTSLDGIDAALVETDGHDIVRPLAFMSEPYEAHFRKRLRQILGYCPSNQGTGDSKIKELEKELTRLHAQIVNRFREQLKYPGVDLPVIDLIGFHGQTIWHQPEKRLTVQIGDGALLANLTKLAVINDFRTADVLAGGQGAPLVPLYHRARAVNLSKPLAIINIGGISNITWIGGEQDHDILAFDAGPGNALIDDWMLETSGQPYDEYGQKAAEGRFDDGVVEEFLKRDFFHTKPPKSLDRQTLTSPLSERISLADGAATLTKITVQALVRGLQLLPTWPERIYVTGGGRLNRTMMRWLADLSDTPVVSVDDLGWSGDGLEAEAFAYLAVRSHLGLSLSLPGTTGVPSPITGGRYYKPL